MTVALQLGAAVVGSFDREIAEAGRRVERSLQGAVFGYTDERLLMPWRADIERSGLAKGRALAFTVRQENYPNKGMNPAALVYVRKSAVHVIAAFESGPTIRASRGKYLLIPNPEVWPGGRVRRARSSAGGRGDQSETLQAAIARWGPLSFVPPRAGRPGLLVATARYDSVRGRFKKLTSRQQEAQSRGVSPWQSTSVVVFFLVKEARVPRLLRGRDIRARAAAGADRAIERRFVYLMEASEGALAAAGAPAR